MLVYFSIYICMHICLCSYMGIHIYVCCRRATWQHHWFFIFFFHFLFLWKLLLKLLFWQARACKRIYVHAINVCVCVLLLLFLVTFIQKTRRHNLWQKKRTLPTNNWQFHFNCTTFGLSLSKHWRPHCVYARRAEHKSVSKPKRTAKTNSETASAEMWNAKCKNK